MGDNIEDTGLTDVVVAQPVVADQNELIVQLMQQIAEMWVEMQRRQDLPNSAFTAPADGRPPFHFPPPNVEQAHNPPSSPVHNPAIIDLTIQNPHYASISYQTPPPPQNTNFQMPPPPQNANLQAGLPSQTQNVNNPQTSLHHQNQHTNPRLTLKTIKPPKMPKIVPDRYSLEKMKQKSNESYREFVYRWRKEAARVRPPMSEKEIIEVFVRVQEPKYYNRIMLLADYRNIPPLSYQNTPPPSYQISPPIYQTPPHHYRNISPNYANVQANFQTPPNVPNPSSTLPKYPPELPSSTAKLPN
ncbi:hypothetical protein R3W88_014150 [Solanum pinnatisectum]|uniref:Uncharacterized protein n=1 Tax=Solanum pinnatisectum TaxID=50273 RepID=A0AAV9KV59_9SOLN|nr:hypothetical protein R3W88_014150 [Solanum pinnatisectum]